MKPIESGRQMIGRIRDGFRSFTTTPPEQITHARAIVSGEIEPEQSEVDSHRKTIIMVTAVRGGLGDNILERLTAQGMSRMYENMTPEDWKTDYVRHLTTIVANEDRRLAKKNPKP